jgi:hypothetical protein
MSVFAGLYMDSPIDYRVSKIGFKVEFFEKEGNP